MTASMDALKLFLSLCVLAAMILVCLLRWDVAGFSALIGGGLGFVGWFLTGGHTSLGERLGNGYVGAFMGLCFGFLVGGAAMLAMQYLH